MPRNLARSTAWHECLFFAVVYSFAKLCDCQRLRVQYQWPQKFRVGGRRAHFTKVCSMSSIPPSSSLTYIITCTLLIMSCQCLGFLLASDWLLFKAYLDTWTKTRFALLGTRIACRCHDDVHMFCECMMSTCRCHDDGHMFCECYDVDDMFSSRNPGCSKASPWYDLLYLTCRLTSSTLPLAVASLQ